MPAVPAAVNRPWLRAIAAGIIAFPITAAAQEIVHDEPNRIALSDNTKITRHDIGSATFFVIQPAVQSGAFCSWEKGETKLLEKKRNWQLGMPYFTTGIADPSFQYLGEEFSDSATSSQPARSPDDEARLVSLLEAASNSCQRELLNDRLASAGAILAVPSVTESLLSSSQNPSTDGIGPYAAAYPSYGPTIELAPDMYVVGISFPRQPELPAKLVLSTPGMYLTYSRKSIDQPASVTVVDGNTAQSCSLAAGNRQAMRGASPNVGNAGDRVNAGPLPAILAEFPAMTTNTPPDPDMLRRQLQAVSLSTCLHPR